MEGGGGGGGGGGRGGATEGRLVQAAAVQLSCVLNGGRLIRHICAVQRRTAYRQPEVLGVCREVQVKVWQWESSCSEPPAQISNSPTRPPQWQQPRAVRIWRRGVG